jgi:hypothetical protein
MTIARVRQSVNAVEFMLTVGILLMKEVDLLLRQRHQVRLVVGW